ncbi:MAG: hypothetical protein FD180_469 [Planctomycetota bacterium]|nr:MAG: hypothetical protein FD180_469 [Planctomycetota bacterium]
MRLLALVPILVFIAVPVAAQTPLDLDRMERSSVDAALSWLARHQEIDGSWKSSGSRDHGFLELYEPDAAAASEVQVTALALLAFLGDGNSPWTGRYHEATRRAWRWLIARQGKSGALVEAPAGEESGTLEKRRRAERLAHLARMNHLWGTLALLEIAASAEFAGEGSASSRVEAAARVEAAISPAIAAVNFVTADAAAKAGAFAFLDERTVTMDELALLAAVAFDCVKLRAAVDLDWFKDVVARIKDVQRGMTGAVVPYRASEDGTYWLRGSVSTPQSMIAFVYMHEHGSAMQMKAAGPELQAHPPRWNTQYSIGSPSRHPDAGPAAAKSAVPEALRSVAEPCCDEIANEYGWFWEGMAFRSYAALNPDGWRRWRSSFVPVAFENQRKSGPEAGSWDAAGPHARVFGRESGTAWMAITMESACRLRMARTNWEDIKPDMRWLSLLENLGKGKPTAEKCLVCGMKVMSNGMFSKGAGKTTWYFCGPDHLDEYERHPEAYAPGETGEGSHK